MTLSLYTPILALLSVMPLVSLFMNWSWLIDLSIINCNLMNMSISLFLDKDASAFILTVNWIFTMVYLYSLSYLSAEVFLTRFLSVLSLFVSSMCILILSGNLFNSLIGWDGLGVTSLFLILFYYSNSSLKAGTLTFLMNRVGDCFFILTLTSVLLVGDMQAYFTSTSFPATVAFMLVLTSISKSAQIPFSTWLPAAMEAPTPVSSLVHSSTLVTAGIYLLYRYSELWVYSGSKEVLSVLSISTCFMAALAGLVENDLKKLIALSTLSQLGFIMFSLSLGMLGQGYLHMLMHAFFKALLFMCAGLIIHSFNSSQNILVMSLSVKQNPLLMSIMSCSLLSMVGLPFLSGFYSKDYIIDTIKSWEWSMGIMFMVVVSFVCTILYSTRIVWYLLKSSKNWHSMSDQDLGMILPMIPLAVLTCVGGSVMSWIFVNVELFVDSSKTAILGLLTASSTTYWMVKSISTSEFLDSKWNLMKMNPIISTSFFCTTMTYHQSSDLLGVPEILNKKIGSTLHYMSFKIKKTMLQYSGSLEFLLFLAGLVFLI